jgi:hypothetical protein
LLVLAAVIVYRQQEHVIDPRAELRQLARTIERLRTCEQPDHDALLGVFIDAAEIASAIADHVAVDVDGPDPAADAARDVVSCLADALVTAWSGDALCTARALQEAQVGIGRVTGHGLRSGATRCVSNGYARDALGPELYAEAARLWAADRQPAAVWCVGVRTIGLSLAAIAAAALRADGIDARVRMVRPRGSRRERHVSIDARLARELTTDTSACYLVVDDGPGHSGSSMAAAAAALTGLRIHASRIVLMPGHAPAVDGFASDVQRQWRLHDVRPASFERTWVQSGRLAADWGADSLEDLSGGQWRRHRALPAVPAIHPRHERRKYRLHRENGDALLKFVGFGHYGDRHLARAQESADAGWSLPPRAARRGWMEIPWWWQPLTRRECAPISQIADYLAFVRHCWSTPVAADPLPLLGMMTSNLREMGCDAEALLCEGLLPRGDAVAVRVDGHMRPHEWLTGGARHLKTDGVEHHDDQFFPGPTDIAWDLAGAIDEWRLGTAESEALVRRYAAATRDWDVTERLPFYRAAYLAFRAGYTSVSAAQLADVPEAARFAAEHAYYRRRLAELVQEDACHSRAS